MQIQCYDIIRRCKKAVQSRSHSQLRIVKVAPKLTLKEAYCKSLNLKLPLTRQQQQTVLFPSKYSYRQIIVNGSYCGIIALCIQMTFWFQSIFPQL